MYCKQTTSKLNLESLIIINCIGTYKRNEDWKRYLNSLVFWSIFMYCKNKSKKAPSKLFERGCNTVHFTLISFLVPMFVCFRMIYLASERCFPYKKTGYFRDLSLLKTQILIKRKLPSVFLDNSPALGSQWSL